MSCSRNRWDEEGEPSGYKSMISFSFHPLKRMEEEIICNRWKDLADNTLSQSQPGLYSHNLIPKEITVIFFMDQELSYLCYS